MNMDVLDDRADRALNELHDYLKSIPSVMTHIEGLFTLDGMNNTEESRNPLPKCWRTNWSCSNVHSAGTDHQRNANL